MNLWMNDRGACATTNPIGIHGHGGTIASSGSRSTAATIARTPTVVGAIITLRCTARSFISEWM
jgi:hypothetical protein